VEQRSLPCLRKYRSNPDDWRPKPVKLPYVFRDAKIAKRETKFAAKHLSERLVAARMAIPFLQRAELGQAPVFGLLHELGERA